MSASLLQTAILSGLEGFLNQVITLDPAAASKLAPLTGRILCVRCELPAMTMNVLVDADRLVLMGGDNLDADATVRGKGTALARLLLSGDTANLRDDIDAWLHEEKKLLPDSVELDAFYQAIDTLRLRADRLEARINRFTMQPR